MFGSKGPRKEDKGFLDPEVWERAQRIMEETGQTDITKVLLYLKLVGEREILQAKAQEVGMAFADLDRIRLDPETVALILADLARELRALPVKRDGNTLWICLDAPDLATLTRIKDATGMRVIPVLCERQALDDALKRLFL